MSKTNFYRFLAILLAPLLLAYTVTVFGVAIVVYAVGGAIKAVAEIARELPELRVLIDSAYLNHQNMSGPFRWWGNLYRGLPAFLSRNDLTRMEAKPTEYHSDRVKVEPRSK